MISNNTQVFQFDRQQVRTVLHQDEPWFVAADVCKVLGYSKTQNAVVAHCKCAKLLNGPDSGQLTTSPRGITIIPERDVYRLIMRSKLPSAERFEEWVVGEVLPQIRKTGAFTPAPTHVPANPLDLMQAMLDTMRSHDQKLAALEHKVNTIVDDQFYTAAGYAGKCGCKLSPAEISLIGRKASKLSRDRGYDMGNVHHPKFPKGIHTYHTDIPNLNLRFPNLNR